MLLSGYGRGYLSEVVSESRDSLVDVHTGRERLRRGDRDAEATPVGHTQDLGLKRSIFWPAKVIEAGLATWSGSNTTNDPLAKSLIVRGRSRLLEDVDAVEDLERIRLLFDELENKRDLVQLLGLAEEADGVLFTMELQAESLHHLFCVAEGLLRCL